VKLSEAVALSLNIAPEKLRRNIQILWDGERFNESEEFAERLFITNRNLETLRSSTFAAMRDEDEDPAMRLQSFVSWAASIEWRLPRELTAIVTGAVSGSAGGKAVTAQGDVVVPRQRGAAPEPLPTRIEITTKREAVASWLGKQYGEGIPPGMTSKEIVRQFKSETKMQVDIRTVRRALGRR
jgi:hypothetical protein